MAKKIVLADDEQFTAIAYKDGLSRAGYIVVVAHDGEEALGIIRKEKPDLVLLDLIMPKMNGFEVLKAVKSDPSLETTPCVVLSNQSQPTDEAQARSLGAADFINKSDTSLEGLLTRIKPLLGD